VGWKGGCGRRGGFGRCWARRRFGVRALAGQQRRSQPDEPRTAPGNMYGHAGGQGSFGRCGVAGASGARTCGTARMANQRGRRTGSGPKNRSRTAALADTPVPGRPREDAASCRSSPASRRGFAAVVGVPLTNVSPAANRGDHGWVVRRPRSECSSDAAWAGDRDQARRVLPVGVQPPGRRSRRHARRPVPPGRARCPGPGRRSPRPRRRMAPAPTRSCDPDHDASGSTAA